LLERTAALDLQGEVELRFPPTGVECRISMPASQVAPPQAWAEAQQPNTVSMEEPTAVAGLRVLLVEDSALVALGVREALEEKGVIVVGPFVDVRSAQNAVERLDFDVALLDVDLNGEPVWPVADLLADARLPFLFLTAYESHKVAPDRFSGRPTVAKPHPPDEIVAALSRLAPRARRRSQSRGCGRRSSRKL
jgi:CheY-like chemotaxis protein